MPQEIRKRHTIIEALCAGRTAKEIIDFFNYNKDLVYRIKKQFEACDDPETFAGERKTHKQHFDAIKSPKFVTKVKQRIQYNPSKSMATLAFKINVNKSTISRTVAKDLNKKSYCLKKHHLLTAALMEQQLIKGTALLNELKHGSSGHVRFFSDEKKFIWDKLHNRQNDCFITDNPEEVPIVMSTKFPTSVMVLGIMSSDGDIMPLTSLPRASGWLLTTTSRSWKPWSSPGWLECVVRGRMSFNKTLRQCIWPVRPRPGCTSNYPATGRQTSGYPPVLTLTHWTIMFGGFWRRRLTTAHATQAGAEDAIVGVMDHMDRMEVKKACSTFRHRLKAVIEKKGGHIK